MLKDCSILSLFCISINHCLKQNWTHTETQPVNHTLAWEKSIVGAPESDSSTKDRYNGARGGREGGYGGWVWDRGPGQRLIMTPVGQVMITHQPPTASPLPSAWLTCLSLLSTLTPVTPKSERPLELQLTIRAFLPLLLTQCSCSSSIHECMTGLQAPCLQFACFYFRQCFNHQTVNIYIFNLFVKRADL